MIFLMKIMLFSGVIALKKVSITKCGGILSLEKKRKIVQLESVIPLLRERANGSFVRGI